MDGNASVPVGRRVRRVGEPNDHRELACEDDGRDMKAFEARTKGDRGTSLKLRR